MTGILLQPLNDSSPITTKPSGNTTGSVIREECRKAWPWIIFNDEGNIIEERLDPSEVQENIPIGISTKPSGKTNSPETPGQRAKQSFSIVLTLFKCNSPEKPQ